jgi:GTP-binding protein EngB required for normal cell division
MSVISPCTVRNEIQSCLVGKAFRGLIEQALEGVDALGQEFAAEREKLCGLESRLLEERFHLAVLGQFKRGKSTLINALLGERILPTAVIPLTAIPTLIRAGIDKKARISFANDRTDEIFRAETSEELSVFLAKFVTEAENPKNYLGVSQVEVFYPSPILTQGVVLIDTPGIGSTFRHNTEATLNFLSQCDAAIFVSSADPPITEVEVLFLKEVRNKVEHLIFIFNKADYLDETEKQDALEFFRIVLRDEAGFGADLPVYCVSARRGLEARQNDDTVKWAQSGLGEFEKHLTDFLVNGKAQTLDQALYRKTAGVVTDIKMQLQITIQSFQMPLAELDNRRQELSRRLGEIERQRIMAEDLLEGDRKRTLEYLEEQAENLRQKARQHLSGILREYSSSSGGMPDQVALEKAIADTIPGLFERELGDMSRSFDRYVTDVLQPHKQRAEDLMGEIRRSAAELFAIPYHAPEAEGVFQMKRKPYWVAHKWPSSLNTIPLEWIDKLLPHTIQRSRIIKRLEEQVESLVNRNVENLRWETLQNLNATFRQFAFGLKEQLRLTMTATQGAIQVAWEKRQNQAETVDRELQRLEGTLARFAKIEQELTAKSETDYKSA